ncbi:MAG: hypothetical protein IPI00_08030 [Flavobacteriales bacterium]|nr:hypothetical protein [Flavobacteriales bacterium]
MQRTQGRVGRRGKTSGIDRAAGALRVYAAQREQRNSEEECSDHGAMACPKIGFGGGRY